MEWLETATGEICLLTGKLISTKEVGQNLEALKQQAFKMDQEVAIGDQARKTFLFIITSLFFF